jgi:hypothetical protein
MAILSAVALAVSLVACGGQQASPPDDTAGPPSAAASDGESPSAATSSSASPSPDPAAGVVPGCDGSSPDATGGLTGVWEASDNGIYYIRETGDACVWWFGTDVGRSVGNQFSNVAVGQVDGDLIYLEWADVPYGNLLNGGILTLQMSPDGNTLTALSATGGFGGHTWTRRVEPSPGASASP